MYCVFDSVILESITIYLIEGARVGWLVKKKSSVYGETTGVKAGVYAVSGVVFAHVIGKQRISGLKPPV